MYMENEFKVALKNNKHLSDYLLNFQKEHTSLPSFITSIPREMPLEKTPNIIYPVGDPIFIHIYGESFKDIEYLVIEPQLKEEEKELYATVFDRVLEKRVRVTSKEDLRGTVLKLIDETVKVEAFVKRSLESSIINVTKEEYDKLRYFIIRDIFDSGPVEPMLRDPYLEDIHCVGVNN